MCNSNYSGDRDQEDHGLRPVRQKVSKTSSQRIRARQGGLHLLSSYEKSINMRIIVQASPGINSRPYCKLN
jgi:hypothetical protein